MAYQSTFATSNTHRYCIILNWTIRKRLLSYEVQCYQLAPNMPKNRRATGAIALSPWSKNEKETKNERKRIEVGSSIGKDRRSLQMYARFSFNSHFKINSWEGLTEPPPRTPTPTISLTDISIFHSISKIVDVDMGDFNCTSPPQTPLGSLQRFSQTP